VQLATIISCGTLAAVLIPEFTGLHQLSLQARHEISTASREGGASLTILSGGRGLLQRVWKGCSSPV